MSSSVTKSNRRSCSNGILSSSSVNASSMSRNRSVTSSSSNEKNIQNSDHNNGRKKKTCMCSPTTHPGSFKCSLHRNLSNTNDDRSVRAKSYSSHRLYALRSAMANSVVRIGSVEGELMKRALASLIRPSSHQQRRRGEFRPRPSRLSVMSRAEE